MKQCRSLENLTFFLMHLLQDTHIMHENNIDQSMRNLIPKLCLLNSNTLCESEPFFGYQKKNAFINIYHFPGDNTAWSI